MSLPALRHHRHQLDLDDEPIVLPEEPEISLEQLLEVEVKQGPERPDDKKDKRTIPGWLVASVSLHLLLIFALTFLVHITPLPPPPAEAPLDFVPIDMSTLSEAQQGAFPEIEKGPQQPPDKEEIPDPMSEQVRGQFVNLPPPDQTKVPKNARYIAADDQAAERELQAKKVQNSPEVVASRFSTQSHRKGDEGEDERTESAAAQAESLASASQPPPNNRPLPQPSEPATMGEPQVMERNPATGRANAPPSNRPPVNLNPSPSALAALFSGENSGAGSRARGGLGPQVGAPDNNVLDVDGGDETALNARKTEYSRFFNALRKQFNYYYGQASDNLSSRDLGQRVFEKTYITRFVVTLGADGKVMNTQILSSAGVAAFDGLVYEALRNASPFPAPPKSLLDERGVFVVSGECRLGVGMGAPSFTAPGRPFGR